MAKYGAGRTVTGVMLFLNFCMYLIVLGLAGWALNRAIDSAVGAGATTSPRFPGGNSATQYFIAFALAAGVLGVASIFAGSNHVGLWRTESLAAAIASGLIAWLFTLLAFGLACKEINLGGFRNRRLKTLEAFVIILAGTQLLYILFLHSGLAGDRFGPRLREPGGGYSGMAQEQPKTGTAAPAV